MVRGKGAPMGLLEWATRRGQPHGGVSISLQQAAQIKVRVSVIVPRNDEILLMRRRRDTRLYWVFPGGGLEPGEELTGCGMRGVREKTALDVTVGRLLYVCETLAPSRAKHHLNLVFLGELAAPGQRLRPTRHWMIEEPQFVRIGELPAPLLLPPVASQLLEDFRKGWEVPIRFLGNLWVEFDLKGIG